MKFITILLISFVLFCCSSNLTAQNSITVSNVTPLTANTNGLATTVVGGAVGVPLPISACPNDQILITVDTQGVFGSNNVLTAQLVSDPTGGLGGVLGGLLGGLGGGLGSGLGGGLGGLGGGLGITTPPAINIGATQPGGSILDPIGGLLGGLIGGITSGGLTGGGLTGGGLTTGITSQTIIGTIPADIANGTYYLRVISSNPADTSANYTSSISIQRATKPTITMSCVGDSTLLTSGINLGSTYSWSTGSTTSSIKVSNTDDNYSLTITNTSGCSATTDTSVIGNTIIMECNYPSMILASVVSADSYLWSTNSNDSSIVIDNTQSENTLISLSTTGPFTCAAIYSPECPAPIGSQEVPAPNVFTPNNDNINDFYLINNAGNNIRSVSIYNSWGQKVFQTENIIGAWDGRNKFGVECTEGTYYYVLEPISASINNISTKGFFQLIR